MFYYWFCAGSIIGEEKFHAANGKAQASTQDALLFFLFVLEGEGGGERDYLVIFPGFPMCSQYVPLKFPMGSHDVPQFHNVFPNSTSLLSQYALEEWCPPFTYIDGSKGRNYIL
jgi:hypothetical protein